MSLPPATSSPRPRDPRAGTPPLPLTRWAQWFVALAALALIAASLGSFFYHRRQLDSIAARHLRLAVVGPPQLQVGAPCSFNLLTTHVDGKPWPVPIDWSLSTRDGKLDDRKEPADDEGRLVMTVPGDKALPGKAGAAAQLRVAAGGGDAAVNTTLPLTIAMPQYVTRLAADRDRYRPGETVYYRSLTVARYGFAAEGALPVEFAILDAKSVPLAGSQRVGLADHGVGNGSFRLPPSLPAGTYTLAARCADAKVSDSRLAIDVAASTASLAATEKPAASKPGDEPAAHIEFFPEGGALAAGLENRVYFSVRDSLGGPLQIRGEVVNGKGESVAKLETSAGGRGRFSFVPAAAESHQAKISQPAGMERPFPLPPASSRHKVAVSTARGVIPLGAPLQLTVRTSSANAPLVVTAFANGLTVGQQMLIASAAEGANGTAVTVPLDDRAAGAVRVTVYDYSRSPPQVVARRLVYRQPRRLSVRAVPAVKPRDDLLLSVENEKGQPVAAALSVTVLGSRSGSRGAGVPPAKNAAETAAPQSLISAPCDDNSGGRPRPGPLRALLLDGEVPDIAALDGVDLIDIDSDAAEAAVDLAFGCQDLALKGKPGTGPNTSGPAATFPVVLDNMDELRTHYEAALGEYRAQRTRVVNAVIMLSFFGGLALALLVTMLALLRIIWSSQFWLPAVAAALCCAVVTAVCNDPSRMEAVEAAAAGFASTLPPSGPPAAQVTSPAQAPPAALPLDSPLRRLAEKLARFGGDASDLKADRFPVQHYTLPESGGAAAPNAGDRPLAWFPLLIAGPNGEVALPGFKASAAKGLRLRIEAHGDGRIASCELTPK